PHADAVTRVRAAPAEVVNVGAADPDIAQDADAVHEVVHAVDAPEKRGLPAARRPDIGGDPVLGHGHGHFLEGQLLAVVEGEVVDLDHGALHHGSRLRPRIQVRRDPDRSDHESLLTRRQCPYTAAVAYFLRSRLRMLMAKRLSSTTIPSRRRVVAKTMGRAASTFGDW